MYENTSASEFASATVAAMIDEMDYEDLEFHQQDPKPAEIEPKSPTRPKEVLSPRIAGTHPLSREITSPTQQSQEAAPLPTIQVSSASGRRVPILKIPSPQRHSEAATLKAQSQHDDEQKASLGPTGFLTKNLGAHDWTTTTVQIDSTTGHFRDKHGRFLLLRGANVAACSKLPNANKESAQYPNPGFYEHRNVDFVGRPFPLEDAPEHFQRLRLWGMTVLRVLVPWEALEHEGPGIYDQRYIEYLRQLFTLAHDFGMKIVIDPHQDAWSRFSGGSGAPGTCGLGNLTHA